MCEKFINKEGYLRNLVLNKILKDYIVKKQSFEESKHSLNTNNKEVFLIDEVDVFFSKEFYGALYTPEATI